MHDTGIVRRIDDLGRVVIPKEIRRTLRMKEGDPLQIYTDKDELLFKKYSPLSSIEKFADCAAESVAEMTGKNCMIVDTDVVVYVSGRNKEIVNKNLSVSFEKILKERRDVLLSKDSGDNIVPVYQGEEVRAESRIIVPVIANGDLYGAVVVSSTENSAVSSTDYKMVKLLASFLSKQFE